MCLVPFMVPLSWFLISAHEKSVLPEQDAFDFSGCWMDQINLVTTDSWSLRTRSQYELNASRTEIHDEHREDLASYVLSYVSHV